MPKLIKLDGRIFAGPSAEARGPCPYCSDRHSSINPVEELSERTRGYDLQAMKLRAEALKRL